MATIILNHRVADYATWRSIFDTDVPMHQAAGLKQICVGQKNGDPNNVFVIWDTPNASIMDTMLADPQLQVKMQEADVVSQPELTIIE